MKNLLFVISLTFFAGTLFSQTATPPSGGNGSSGNPYQIATLNNLYWITQNSNSWSSYFIQTADIDADSTSSWATGAGFTPIGNSTIAFTGSYDGQTYKITGLYINRTTQYNGLFGFVSGGTLKNVIVKQGQIIGGDNCAGGLVGYLYYSSNATNCSSTCSVSGTFDVGGLIGAQDASSSTNNCYSGGSVTGSGGGIGGLIGISSRTSTVKNSYSTASVTGTNNSFSIGGLIGGENSCTDTNCYSTGPVTGTAGSTNVGGLIGKQLFCSASNCFWDTASSGNDTSGLGIGKSTAEMKTQSTFTNATWDFTTIWSINSSVNNGYPYLASNLPTFVEEAPIGRPRTLSLLQNYPNPFNPTTTIQFSVEKDGRSVVKAFDLLGRTVTTLYENVARAGRIYSIPFNGSQFSSGVYFYSIESGNQHLVKKMLMVK